TLPPSEALGQLTSRVMSANAPSMSRLLNAEYACSMRVCLSVIEPPQRFSFPGQFAGVTVAVPSVPRPPPLLLSSAGPPKRAERLGPAHAPGSLVALRFVRRQSGRL